MTYNPNNLNKGTQTNKMRKIDGLTDFITQKIDSSQEIKRFLKYQTKSPLSSSYKDLNGDIVNQPDIKESLIDFNIFDSMFYEEMASDLRNYIFIYSPSGRFLSSTGDIEIKVDILTSEKYNKLKYSDEKRLGQIANYIADLLDEYTVSNDDEVSSIIGNPTMTQTSYGKFRLSKTNDYLVLSMTFKVPIVTLRSRF